MKLFLAIFILALSLPGVAFGQYYVVSGDWGAEKCVESKDPPVKKEGMCPRYECDSSGNLVDILDKENRVVEKATAAGLNPTEIEKIKDTLCNKSLDDWLADIDNRAASAKNDAIIDGLKPAANMALGSSKCTRGSTEEKRRQNELREQLGEDKIKKVNELEAGEIDRIMAKICVQNLDAWLADIDAMVTSANNDAENDTYFPAVINVPGIVEIFDPPSVLDDTENDNNTPGCWVKGNHIFSANCNVFNGNPVVGNKDILELGNIYVFTDFESISQMKAENPQSCKTCMEKVYKTFKGQNDNHKSDYSTAKNNVARKMVQKLKPKSIVPKLLDISKTIEDVARASALYQPSIDSFLAKVSEEDKLAYQKAMQCPNSDDLLAAMKTKCADEGFEFNEAQKHLETALDSLGLKKVDMTQSFESLKKSSVSKPSNKCSGDVNMQDLQVSNFLAAVKLEDDQPETAATNMVYKALDKILEGDTRLDSFCDPDTVRLSSPGEMIESGLNGLSGELKNMMTPEIKQYYEQVAQELKKDPKFDATNETTFRGSTKLVFMSAMSFDPNLRVLLSDWGSFCELRNSFKNDNENLTDKEKEDNPIKSKRLVRGKAEADRDEKLDDEQAKRILDYAKTRCNAAYDKIVEVACYAGDDIKSPLFADYHLEDAAKDLHEELEKEADANPNTANEKHAEMVLLGGLTCAKMDFSESSKVTKDPLRMLGTFGLSNFSREKLRDGLAKGRLCDNPNDETTCKLLIPDYGALTNLKEDAAGKLCVEAKASKEIMLAEIYGKAPDDKILIDHVARNIETYSKDDPEFVKNLAAEGHLDGHPRALNRARSLAGTPGGSNPVKSLGGVNTGGGEAGFNTTDFNSSNDMNEKSLANTKMESEINKRLFEESEANKVLDKAMSNSGGDIEKLAAEWEKERAALMKKHEEELKALRDQIANAQKDPSSLPPKELDALQDRVDKLLKEKEAIGMGDEIVKNLEKVAEENGEKGKLENKVSPSTIQKKKDEVIAGSTSTSFPAGSGASGNRANLPNSINYIPRSVYQDGVGGYVFVQDNKLASIQLEDLSDMINDNQVDIRDIQLDFITANGNLKLVKIPGYTSGYIEIEQLKAAIQKNPGLDFLKDYLLHEQNPAGIEKDSKLKNKAKEVMIVSIDEANDAPARLRDMKYAMNELMTFREACAENNKAKADMIALSLQSSTDPETAIFGKAFQCE
jgi:hypothetical protein